MSKFSLLLYGERLFQNFNDKHTCIFTHIHTYLGTCHIYHISHLQTQTPLKDTDLDFPDSSLVKNPPVMQETPFPFPCREDPLEKGEATHSSILGLHSWLSWLWIHLQCRRPGLGPWVGKIPWRREGLPTPVFWPGEFHGLSDPGGCKKSDMTEWLSLSSVLALLHIYTRYSQINSPAYYFFLIKNLPLSSSNLNIVNFYKCIFLCEMYKIT